MRYELHRRWPRNATNARPTTGAVVATHTHRQVHSRAAAALSGAAAASAAVSRVPVADSVSDLASAVPRVQSGSGVAPYSRHHSAAMESLWTQIAVSLACLHVCVFAHLGPLLR